MPDFAMEERIGGPVAGLDEVGRGPWPRTFVHEVEIGAAEISFDPAAVDRSQIVEAVENRGYSVHE